MLKRPLGKTGIEVSEIAFGGVEIGMPYGIGIKNRSDMTPEAEAIKLLHTSVEAGINYFDTARMYGNSETIMGKAFVDRRDKVILETKCKHFLHKDGTIPEYHTLKNIIETSLSESLKELKTDYVDVFMLHQAKIEILENEDVSQIFLNLKKYGKVRAIGVSTYSLEETKKSIESGIWEIIQLPFNLLDQRQQKLFSLASREGVGITIRSVLLKGLLTNRAKTKNLHPALKDVQNHIKKYFELLEEPITELPSLATKFPLSFKEVSSVLVGIDRLEYLHKSLEAANGYYLDRSSLWKAQALAYPDPVFLNLSKWDRMGWLK